MQLSFRYSRVLLIITIILLPLMVFVMGLAIDLIVLFADVVMANVHPTELPDVSYVIAICYMSLNVLLLLVMTIRMNLWRMRFETNHMDVWFGNKLISTRRLDEVVQIHSVVVGRGPFFKFVIFSFTHSDKRDRKRALWRCELLSTLFYKTDMLVVPMIAREVDYIRQLFSHICPVEEECRFG